MAFSFKVGAREFQDFYNLACGNMAQFGNMGFDHFVIEIVNGEFRLLNPGGVVLASLRFDGRVIELFAGEVCRDLPELEFVFRRRLLIGGDVWLDVVTFSWGGGSLGYMCFVSDAVLKLRLVRRKMALGSRVGSLFFRSKIREDLMFDVSDPDCVGQVVRVLGDYIGSLG